MTHRLPNTRSKLRAFTLVELLIVGVLIAIFAGLAVINVQQQYVSNQRKAVIGETRQIASALDFAYNDLGFFPKIAFLQDSVTGLRLESERQFGNPDLIFNVFQGQGIPTLGRATTIQQQWQGPYFSASSARSRIVQGRGGSRLMRVTTNPAETGFPWPVDAFNNPYMLYTLNFDGEGGLFFTVNTQDNPTVPETNPGAVGNAFNAVVSYGRNQVPGGGELLSPLGDPNSTETANNHYGLRLYTGNPESTTQSLRLLNAAELTRQNVNGARRANVWGTRYAQDAGLGVGFFPTGDAGEPIGITDIGSDDIVFTF